MQLFSTSPPEKMRRKRAHQGHREIHPDNQGASNMWMSLHTLQEIHKINDKISGTRHDNLLKHAPIPKWDIKRPQTSGHHPRVLKYILQ